MRPFYGPYPECDRGEWSDHPKDVVRLLYTFAHCYYCSSDRGLAEYPNILGGKGQIVWRSSDQARSVLARVERDYVKECQAFLSALGERTWSEDEARSKVTITVRDNRSVRTILLPDPGGVVRIVSR